MQNKLGGYNYINFLLGKLNIRRAESDWDFQIPRFSAKEYIIIAKLRRKNKMLRGFKTINFNYRRI